MGVNNSNQKNSPPATSSSTPISTTPKTIPKSSVPPPSKPKLPEIRRHIFMQDCSKIVIRESCVNVQQGDLTTVKTDVIVVCSSSKHLLENILKVSGDSIRSAFENGPKDSLITIATNGQLPCKEIYFLPWTKDADDSVLQKSLKIFVSKVVEKAVQDQYKSIAIPAIGCGLLRCPIALVAESMIGEAHQQAEKHHISINFIIQTDQTNVYNEFQKQLSVLLQDSPSTKSEIVLTSIGKSTLTVSKGNLTTEKVDAIIVSMSSDILRKTILKAAGQEIETTYETQRSQNPNALIIVTQPGLLPCKAILFVQWKPNPDTTILRQSIVDLIWNVIQNAMAYNYTSIAFPAIGCGKHACAVDIIVDTMVSAVKKQILDRNLSLNINYVIESNQENVYDEFCKHVLASDHDQSCSIENFVASLDEQKSSDTVIASNWTFAPNMKLRHEVIETSDEYKVVANKFLQEMGGMKSTILKIERIQNERWYKQYLVHRQDFKKRLHENTEKRLYHGCPEEAANSIIEDCFNRSFAGKNGTLFGVGVYFSAHPHYSNTYSLPNSNGERFMFVASVLVGKTTQGNSSMKTRPLGFDSTTDGNHIFVTYHDAQAYAEYLITYKLTVTSS